MEWASLIPAGLSMLSGLFGGNQNTSTQTTTPQLTPQMQQAVDALMKGATKIAAKPYPKYPGRRVAAPTPARGQVAGSLGQVGQMVNAGASDANGYKARIASMLGRGPIKVAAPNLIPSGGPQAGYAGGM